MRILHVSQPVDGGVGRYIADLSRHQARSGWGVAVACPPHGSLWSRLAEEEIEGLPWPAGRVPGSAVWSETRRLRRLIAARSPDLIHLHSSKAGLAGRLAVRGDIPTVFQPHAWSFHAVPSPIRPAAVAWERVAARWTTVVVCVSEGERGEGERASIRARYALVPNGVNADGLPEADERVRAAARRRLSLDANPLVLCVGRLSRQKGQDVLLKAWPLIRSRIPQARLVLIGVGPEEPRLRSILPPGADLVGGRDDVAEWMAASDVVAIPSRWEGMSLVMLEAMSRGRSVVSTDVAGAREALGGSAGEVTPVGDAGALAAAVAERLFRPDLAAREGRAGRRAVEARYRFDRVAATMDALYREVLAGPNAPS